MGHPEMVTGSTGGTGGTVGQARMGVALMRGPSLRGAHGTGLGKARCQMARDGGGTAMLPSPHMMAMASGRTRRGGTGVGSEQGAPWVGGGKNHYPMSFGLCQELAW